MKTLIKFSFVALLVCLSSVAAFSQARSIKSVAEDAVYHSEDDGFEISLPANMVRKQSKNEAGKTGNAYLWEFSDAAIVVVVEKRSTGVKTDADVAASVAGYKSAFLKGDKILSESPAKIGDYRGTAFVTEDDEGKNLILYLVWDKFAVIIVGSTPSKSAEIQKLVLEAVQSFEFVE